MEPDFVCIRHEIDKLRPSLPAALDRAFELMEKHQLGYGGDKHHGLMRSIWPKYKNFQKSPWNLVRLPRQVHVEVHVLMAASFVGTAWFPKFNSAQIIAHAATGSKFDSLKWQTRIHEFTRDDGKLYIAALRKKYGLSLEQGHYLWKHAKKRCILTANQKDSAPRKHEKRVCKVCKSIFVTRACRDKDTCSNKCRYNSIRKTVDRTCKQCRKMFSVRKSELQRGRRNGRRYGQFCSRKCKYEFSRRK